MNYIGSKLSLLNFIKKSILEIIDKDSCKIFCDLFAGTGAVGLMFKELGFNIISNDIQYYSYILNQHYIGNSQLLEFKNLNNIILNLNDVNIENKINIICDYLNNLELITGFIYNNYSLNGTKNNLFQRLYFSDCNAKKCDTIRIAIEQWHIENFINDNEYYYLLACLLENIDKYANTASVYGAFLKKLKKTAEKDFFLKPIKIFTSETKNIVFNQNANELIKNINSDILYLDPPYNERQYCTNYHLLETIAKYDNPIIKGKTGLREYQDQKSKYCSKNTVKTYYEDLISNTKSKYIFLSYNNEGLLNFEDIKNIMSKKGKYGYFKKEYSRFKSNNNVDQESKTIEYLHYCICCN